MPKVRHTRLLARAARRASLSLVLAGAIVVLVGNAQASSLAGTYTVGVSPAAAGAGASADYTVTVTNTSDLALKTLGTADVAIPAHFRVTQPADGASVDVAAAGGSKSWTVTNAGGELQFRPATVLDALAPFESVSVEMTATSSCVPGVYPVQTTAGAADLLTGVLPYQAESAPAMTVTGTGGLAFEQQPTMTRKTTATDPAVIQPAVTVKALDPCGEHDASATGNVEMALGANPSGATLGGTLSQPLVDGVATFGDLSIDKAGQGYTLTASSAGRTPTTSEPFDVVDVLCTAFPCHAADPGGTTRVVVNGNNAELDASLGISMSAPGIAFGDAACGAARSLGSVVTIAPDPSGTYASLLDVSFAYSKDVAPGTGVANFRFCANDGPNTAWYDVPACEKLPVAKCIHKRNRTGVGDLVVRAYLTWHDPDWGGAGVG